MITEPRRRNSEPSAWLRGAIARRLREPLVAALLAAPPDRFQVLGVPLTTAGDRACDRCGRTVPEGETLWTGAVLRGRALIVFGLCDAHVEAEVIE